MTNLLLRDARSTRWIDAIANAVPLLFLLVASSLLPLLASCSSAASWSRFPVDSRGLDSRFSGVFRFDVVSPPEMSGPVRINIAWDSPSLVGDYNGRLLIPAAGEDPSGCTPFVASHFDDGTAWNGSMLLLQPGSCSSLDQHANAAAVGARGFVLGWVVDDLFSNGADSASAPGSPYVPYWSMNANDAVVLANAISANRSVPFLISINGTGPIHPHDAAIVLQVLQQLDANYPGGVGSIDCLAIYCGNLRTYSDALADPSIDFCTDRMTFVWCVHGRVVWVAPQAFGPDTVPMALGMNYTLLAQLPQLAAIAAVGASGFTGAVPATICDCTGVVWIHMGQINGLTSLPDCFDRMPDLFLVVANGNFIDSLPDTLLTRPRMTYLDMSANAVTHFNSALVSSAVQPWLTVLRLGQNSITVPLPNFARFSFLREIQLSQNSFYVPPSQLSAAPSYFNSLPALQQLSLANNNLSMPLPLLAGSGVVLQILSISNNGFYGQLPNSWSGMTALTTLSAGYNQITSPLSVLPIMTSLQSLDLSYNSLTSAIGLPMIDAAPCFTEWAFVSLPLSLQSVSLRGNGMFFNTPDNGAGLSCAITHLDLGYNDLRIFYPAFLQGCLTFLDISHNNMEGSLTPGSLAPGATFFSVADNPLFADTALLDWMVPNPASLTSTAGSSIQCATIVAPSQPLLAIHIDPTYLNYQLCTCVSGTFPSPALPNCSVIPDVAALPLPSDHLQQNTTRVASLLLIQTEQWKQLNALSLNSTAVLTDSTFGEQRAVSGINTKWLINASAAAVGDAAPPVVTLFLSVNLDLFVGATNLLSVFAGADTQGALQFILSGNELADLAASQATTAAHVIQPLLPFPRAATFVIQVLHPLATIQFQSRDTSGQHFVERHVFSSECPPHYVPTKQFQALGVNLPSTLPSCEPIEFCTTADVQWKLAACDESAGTRLLTYNFGSQCLSGNYQAAASSSATASSVGSLPTEVVGSGISLPSDVSPSCDYIPRSSIAAVVLIAFLVLALLASVGSLLMLAFLHWKHTPQRVPHPLLIWRLLGSSLYLFPVGSVLFCIVGLLQLGPRTDSMCAGSVALWIGALACMQSVTLCAVYTTHQQLTRPLFNAGDAAHVKRVTALQASILVVNGVLLFLTGLAHPSSLSSQTIVFESVSGGAQVPVRVCAAPDAWFILLSIVINAAWWSYTAYQCWGQLATIGRVLDEVNSEIQRLEAADAARSNKKNTKSGVPTGVKVQLETARLRQLQISSTGMALLTSSLLAAGILVLWRLSSTQPGSAASLAAGSAVLCLLAALLPLLGLFGRSLYVMIRKSRRVGLRPQPRASTEVAAAASAVRGSTNGSHRMQSESSVSGSTSSYADPTAASLHTTGDPFREAAASSSKSGFSDIGSILANPITLVQLYEYTRRTYQEESLHFLIQVRLLIGVIKHIQRNMPQQQPMHAFGLAQPSASAALDREATSLPNISVSSLFTSSGAAALAGSGSGIRGGIVPVFGDGTFLPRLHAQMHICRGAAIDSNDSSAPDAVFLPRVGEVLFAAFEIYNLHVHAGCALEINISESRRATLRAALATACSQAAMHVDSINLKSSSSTQFRFSPSHLGIMGALRSSAGSGGTAAAAAGGRGERPAPIFEHNVSSSHNYIEMASVTPPASPPGPVPLLWLPLAVGPTINIPDSNSSKPSEAMGPGSPTAAPLSPPFPSRPQPWLLNSAAAQPQLLLDPLASSGAFLSPSAYLPMSVLVSPCHPSWLHTIRSSLQDVASEVADLVSVNVLSTFRQSREGDETNRLLTFVERLQQFSPAQQVAIMQLMASMVTDEHGSAPPLPPPAPAAAFKSTNTSSLAAAPLHLGLQQLHSLLHGMPFQRHKADTSSGEGQWVG